MNINKPYTLEIKTGTGVYKQTHHVEPDLQTIFEFCKSVGIKTVWYAGTLHKVT